MEHSMSSRLCALSDPLITIDDGTRERRTVTIVELLHRLGSGLRSDPAYLQPHQSHAWHAFLCQLAALAMARGGLHALNDEPDAWAASLLNLSAGTVEPWCLLVEDLSKPALFQPPVPEGTLDGFSHTTRFPDEIDVLITGRNHDLKDGRIGKPRPEHWLFALTSMQTMSGFAGRGTYGIARMNSGYGTRVCVAVTSGLGAAERFGRDVGTWLRERSRIVDAGFGYADNDGHALLWLLPWDGHSSLGLTVCDPFFIEISRRIRLAGTPDSIRADFTSTDTPRISAAELKGNTGDIWTPTKLGEEPSALTISSLGFSYRLTHQLLLGGDYRKSPAQEISYGATHDHLWVGQGLVRGQGTTDGYRERWLWIPGRIIPLLGAELESVGRLASERVSVVDEVMGRMLLPALCALLQGGRDELKFKDERTGVWKSKFDRRIDRIFFDALWNDIESGGEDDNRRWKHLVVNEAAAVLASAIEEAPIPLARHYRAISACEALFWGGARKNFPEIYNESTERELSESPEVFDEEYSHE